MSGAVPGLEEPRNDDHVDPLIDDPTESRDDFTSRWCLDYRGTFIHFSCVALNYMRRRPPARKRPDGRRRKYDRPQTDLLLLDGDGDDDPDRNVRTRRT